MPTKVERKMGMGLITDVSDVQTHEDSGREFIVLHVGGDKDQHKFSCWKPELFDELQQGASINFQYTQKGKWKNIVELDSDGNGQPTSKDELIVRQTCIKKDELIVRQTCIKVAGPMIGITGDTPAEKTAEAITIAELLEAWVWGKKTTEPSPPEDE